MSPTKKGAKIALKFYINKGRRCAQTAIKSAITKESISYKELDFLTGRKENQITAPIQIAYGLFRLNKEFIYPVKSLFFEEFEKLQEITKKEFGQNNFNKTNFEFIIKAKEELIKSKNYFLKDSLELEEIQSLIEKEKIPICLINYDLFVGRENKKEGHYIIISKIKNDYVKIMDSGPCGANPNKKISRKRLEDSLMQTPLDYGVVFV